MRGLDVLGAKPTPSRGPRAAPHPSTPAPKAKPNASTGPSARSIASAHKAQAAASRAVAAGQRLSKHNKSAGKKLIATGNAHNARAQKLLKGSGRRGGAVMGVQGPDPGDVVDPQTDAVNAAAQLGELTTQLLDWVTTLQTNGPQAAWKQVVQAQRSAM